MTTSRISNLVASVVLVAAVVSVGYRAAYGSLLLPQWFRSSVHPAVGQFESFKDAELMGSVSAPVGLVEYADFQCPFCGEFARDVLPVFKQQYVATGRVAFAFRHWPLEPSHRFALEASIAALCAGHQGRFWEMQAALFHQQRRLDRSNLLRLGSKLKLNEDELRQCLDTTDPGSVRRGKTRAHELGLSGTPSFLLGRREGDGIRVTRVLTGQQTIAQIREAVERLLTDQKPARSSR